ncbi:hypothetical protein OQI_17045 [Streptomyces pharetrae CZA14]|uniref:Uncharacterized protein n=1 Tax=Streptomyces pharetrae CZA14 TaxID=1144883 RepID=A0ABX3YHM5_9ACTN|nr:hypothetical protein OQI_17045 [Streptomyces pharetrae CZA14]
MTERDDPWLIDAIWRAADLTRAYLVQDRIQVATCLTGLDTTRLERVLTWLILEHDALFDALGEPSMSVRELDAAAALAPLETELAMMTAVRRVATKEMGLTGAVEGLAPLDRVHAIAICTAVMLLEARGRTTALEQLDAETVRYQQMGYPRPYTIT